ncbi:MAG: DUF1993 domain-containing protein [Sphingobium sp.]
MAMTLFDVTVPSFQQIVRGLQGAFETARIHAQASGLDPDMLAGWRLADDMYDLRMQVLRVASHSRGALDDVQRGTFTIPGRDALDFESMRQVLADAETAVGGWTREAVEALAPRKVIFDTGSSPSTFTGEAFLLSFSLPNFYFHAVTAYDILRANGVPIGKRDYLSGMRYRLG